MKYEGDSTLGVAKNRQNHQQSLGFYRFLQPSGGITLYFMAILIIIMVLLIL
jgi:hypothetical protein